MHDIGIAKSGTFAVTIMDNKVTIYLFENGKFITFMDSEVEMYLEEIGILQDSNYYFENLIKLNKDFKQGFFDEIFERAKKIKKQ